MKTIIRRYPALTGLVLGTPLAVSFLAACAWLLTHEACAHPIGSGLAAWWAFVECPLCLLALCETLAP